MGIPFGVAFALLSITAFGQIAQPLPGTGVLGGARAETINEPFSADAITTIARTLADGTHIARQTMTVKMYRDSAGRVRSDRIPSALSTDGPAPPATILIRDPLSGYSYVLETRNKIARRSVIQKSQPASLPMNLPAAPKAAPPSAARTSQPKAITEDLGTQIMQGLMVQGRRTTVTYPAGSMGNDRDIATVSEIWTNRELGLMILQVRSDPRSGEVTTKLENVSRTQPDPDLFLPPPDYKIVDMSAGQ